MDINFDNVPLYLSNLQYVKQKRKTSTTTTTTKISYTSHVEREEKDKIENRK